MQPGKLIRVSGLYVILLPRTLIRKTCSAGGGSFYESTTTRKAGGLDFTAIGGKRQGCEAPGLENPIESRKQGLKGMLA